MPKSCFFNLGVEEQRAYQAGREAGQAGVLAAENTKEYAFLKGVLAGQSYARKHFADLVKEEAADETPTAPIPPMPASRPPVFQVPTDADLDLPIDAFLPPSYRTEVPIPKVSGQRVYVKERLMRPGVWYGQYDTADGKVCESVEAAHAHEKELGLPLTEYIMLPREE